MWTNGPRQRLKRNYTMDLSSGNEGPNPLPEKYIKLHPISFTLSITKFQPVQSPTTTSNPITLPRLHHFSQNPSVKMAIIEHKQCDACGYPGVEREHEHRSKCSHCSYCGRHKIENKCSHCRQVRNKILQEREAREGPSEMVKRVEEFKANKTVTSNAGIQSAKAKMPPTKKGNF